MVNGDLYDPDRRGAERSTDSDDTLARRALELGSIAAEGAFTVASRLGGAVKAIFPRLVPSSAERSDDYYVEPK